MKQIIRYIGSRCFSTKPLATGHSRPVSAAFALSLALAATLPFGGWASEIVVPSDSIATIQDAVGAEARPEGGSAAGTHATLEHDAVLSAPGA